MAAYRFNNGLGTLNLEFWPVSLFAASGKWSTSTLQYYRSTVMNLECCRFGAFGVQARTGAPACMWDVGNLVRPHFLA